MILYKYFQPERLNVLENKRIRFTQPGDFNDPFEFRPWIKEAASDQSVRTYVEENFEVLVEQELAKYGALIGGNSQTLLKNLLVAQKDRLPELYRLLESPVLEKISPKLDEQLNHNVGVLCLSEVRDSLLMWGHYTQNHRGFVVGFDSEHQFFAKRRTEQDEFGFLRKVDYQLRRPHVTLSDTTSPIWFQTKSNEWAYEKEWRIVRVLSEAVQRIACEPFPICLFDFPADTVVEIILGMRCPQSLQQQIRALMRAFPKAILLNARENPREYKLIIEAPST